MFYNYLELYASNKKFEKTAIRIEENIYIHAYEYSFNHYIMQSSSVHNLSEMAMAIWYQCQRHML